MTAGRAARARAVWSRWSALVLFVATLGCSGEGGSVITETRFPDDEGVVTAVTLERMELGGERAYTISTGVESFKSRSHEVTQLLFWDGKYVQLGLGGDDEVVWIAGLGTVTRTDPPIVRYSGVFEEIDPETGRAVFEDGTTLAVAEGLDPPSSGTEVAVIVDPAATAITEFSN